METTVGRCDPRIALTAAERPAKVATASSGSRPTSQPTRTGGRERRFPSAACRCRKARKSEKPPEKRGFKLRWRRETTAGRPSCPTGGTTWRCRQGRWAGARATRRDEARHGRMARQVQHHRRRRRPLQPGPNRTVCTTVAPPRSAQPRRRHRGSATAPWANESGRLRRPIRLDTTWRKPSLAVEKVLQDFFRCVQIRRRSKEAQPCSRRRIIRDQSLARHRRRRATTLIAYRGARLAWLT